MTGRRAGRPIIPRRRVVIGLHAVRTRLKAVQDRWDIRMTIWDNEWRVRRNDELPENDPAEWAYLGSTLNTVIADLVALRQHAYDQYNFAKERQ